MFKIQESPNKIYRPQDEPQTQSEDDELFRKVSFSSFEKLKQIIHGQVSTTIQKNASQELHLYMIKQLSQQEQIIEEQHKVTPFTIEQNNEIMFQRSNYNQIKHYRIIKLVQKWIKKFEQLRILKKSKRQILDIQQFVLLLVCLGYISSQKKGIIINNQNFRKIMKICMIYQVAKYNGFYIKNIISLLCILQGNYKPYVGITVQYSNLYGQFDSNNQFFPYKPQVLNSQFQLKLSKQKFNGNNILQIKKHIDRQLRQHILNEILESK